MYSVFCILRFDFDCSGDKYLELNFNPGKSLSSTKLSLSLNLSRTTSPSELSTRKTSVVE